MILVSISLTVGGRVGTKVGEEDLKYPGLFSNDESNDLGLLETELNDPRLRPRTTPQLSKDELNGEPGLSPYGELGLDP